MHIARGLSSFVLAFLCGAAECAESQSLDTRPLPGSRPNVLLIVADDLGYNDIGVFGSEIRTPNIDRLAMNGTILTNYYTAPLCAPTRAMLLSGTDHHRAGQGLMDTRVEGAPGYEGYLNHRVVSLAERLKTAGYHTYIAGKWHLGYEQDQSAAARGFERSFTLLGGGASHFATGNMMPGGVVRYRDNGKVVDDLPKDFYSTVYYTDKMIGYMKEQAGDGKPFFAYLAYTAPHWPVHALDEDIVRQRGRYDEGYDVLRQRRFNAWKAAGFARKDAQPPKLPPDYKPWKSLSSEEKGKSARAMEVYAAMVERMDTEIGRVLRYLEASGQIENTVIMFQSDNGAEGMEGIVVGTPDNRLENIGRPGSWAFIGRGWAEAGSVPYYLQKVATAEGGIHVPAIVAAPTLGVPAGRRNDAVLIASDVAPTFLELAGVDEHAILPGALPITGRSFADVLRGDDRRNRRGTDDVLGWEHSGHAAVRKGDWKLLWVGGSMFMGGGGQASNEPAGPGTASSGMSIRKRMEAGGAAGDPAGSGGPWMLFNLRDDPAELHDLSKQRPDVMEQMLAEWRRYAAENGVIVKKGSGAK